MNSTKELFLQAMCEKHGGDFETVKNYIEIFNDMLREINFTSSLVVYRTYTLEEIETLKKELKEYKDIVFNSAMNRPHPAESMLKLMNGGHMTIHPKKD